MMLSLKVAARMPPMNTSVRRRFVIAPRFGVVALTLMLLFVSWGGRAWACLPQPLVSLQPSGSGPAGTEVTVNAISVAGSAEIRWNGSDGPLLGTATGPAFSSKVKIPAVAPGLYTIVVLERTATGSLGSTGLTSYLVTAGGPAATPAAVAPARGFDSLGEPPTAPSAGRGEVSAVVALTGGATLLALGLLGGALLSPRRRRARAVTAT